MTNSLYLFNYHGCRCKRTYYNKLKNIKNTHQFLIFFLVLCVCVCVCVCLDKSFIFAKILWNLKTVSFLVNACLTALSFSHSVLSDSLQPRGLQHSRLLCPSPTPRACSNSCPLIWWCHPTISSSCLPTLLPVLNLSQNQVFSHELALIKWPECWSFSFSFSPSSECSGLISFRIDWFDLLAVHWST